MSNENKKEEPVADMYLLLEGIKGSVTEPGHEGWIKISSVQFGAGVGISSSRYRRQTPEEKEAQRKKMEEEEAAAKERGETEDEAWERRLKSTASVSSPSISEFTLTKETDATSPLIFHNTVLRKPARRATIDIVHRADKMTTRFEMATVFVSGFSFSMGRNGRPNESLSLNYREIEFGVRPGGADTAVSVRYDMDKEDTYLNGELVPPFFEKKEDNDDY